MVKSGIGKTYAAFTVEQSFHKPSAMQVWSRFRKVIVSQISVPVI